MMTWVCRATVVRIIDGDTFVADLDLGWFIWRRTMHIRLLGIDTPERGQEGWAEATLKLTLALPLGSLVWLESEKLDSFGRTLGVVRLDDGTDVRTLL
jgi:micrococcal nuclease